MVLCIDGGSFSRGRYILGIRYGIRNSECGVLGIFCAGSSVSACDSDVISTGGPGSGRCGENMFSGLYDQYQEFFVGASYVGDYNMHYGPGSFCVLADTACGSGYDSVCSCLHFGVDYLSEIWVSREQGGLDGNFYIKNIECREYGPL